MSKKTPALSPATAARLKAAHAVRRENEIPLLALVHALRATGWSLASIAEPLEVSREIIRVWDKKYLGLTDPPTVTVETVPSFVPKATIASEEASMRQSAREVKETAALAAALPRLQELQPLAENLRGPSRFNPAGGEASREYTELLNATLAAGVRTRVLAEALGVKEITIHARLRRAGFRKTSPSEYVPQWARPDWKPSVPA